MRARHHLAVACDWEWQTDPASYGSLFGKTAAALADIVGAPRVLLAAECVDDEPLEQALRAAGWQLELPTRKTSLFGTTSEGALSAWRVVANEEAAEFAPALWEGVAATVRACPVRVDEAPSDATEVGPLLGDGRPALVSFDRDSVGVLAAPDETERALFATARAAARRAGGDIRTIPDG